MAHPERTIGSYVHNGRIGVLVELGMLSDFTSQSEKVQNILSDVAMHVAASSPESISSLLDQPFVKNPELTVRELLSCLSQEVQEEIEITRFVRWDTVREGSDKHVPPRDPATAVRLKAVK